MYLRTETLSEKKLAGKRMTMSLTSNKTGELWRSFMNQRSEIVNNVGNNLFSMQHYPEGYFDRFNPATEFEKWAAIEVANFDTVPVGMESTVLTGGLYAVFLHRGPASTGPKTFQYVYAVWLPQSNYLLDSRPHFELLGEKYKNEDPTSEEEIWIPIKPKPV